MDVVGLPAISLVFDPVWAVAGAIGSLVLVWIGATARAPIRQRNEARHATVTQTLVSDDPRITALPLIDEGKELRRRCEGVGRPPIEAAERWRDKVKHWLIDNGLQSVMADWDRFPGKTNLDPNTIEGFSGLISSDGKTLWDGLNIRILRLEELLRRL